MKKDLTKQKKKCDSCGVNYLVKLRYFIYGERFDKTKKNSIEKDHFHTYVYFTENIMGFLNKL